MIGTQFTLTNQLGDSIILNDHSDPNNLIALQDYPTFELEVKNQEIQKEGQHGIWDFFSFYGKRLITFSGVIVGDDEEKVTEIQDQLKLVCGLPEDPSDTNSGILTIAYTDPRGRAVQTTGKLFNAIRFSRSLQELYRLNFQIVLKSADPIIESQTPVITIGTRGYEIGNIQLPTKMPVKLNILKRSLEVINSGNAYTSPIITIHGELTNPRIENLNTGRFMSFNYTIALGDYIVINSKLGTVVDQDGVDLTGYLDAGSQFIKLKGGSNMIYLISDENEISNLVDTRVAPTEELDVEYRDTFI